MCIILPLSPKPIDPLTPDVNAVDRKGKPIDNTFGRGFFWSEIIDAAADVYNGVCDPSTRTGVFELSSHRVYWYH